MKTNTLTLTLLVISLTSLVSAAELTNQYFVSETFEDQKGRATGRPSAATANLSQPQFVGDVPTGFKGESVQFVSTDGKRSFVLLPKSVVHSTSGSVTFWAKPQQMPGKRGAAYFLVLPPPKSGLSMVIPANSNGIAAQVADAKRLDSRRALKEKEWSHLALTWTEESNKVQLYVNGAIVADGELTTLPEASLPVRVGSYKVADKAIDNHNQYVGLLYDLRFYRGALSADEIKALINP